MSIDSEEIDRHKPTAKNKSLLSKYEIPVDHLNYEYIGACNNIKELEKIVKILRSGEEGYFPDLQKAAEERLRLISPNNRHLRVESSALTRDSLNKEEWDSILGEVSRWKKGISETDLRLAEDSIAAKEILMPPVRQSMLGKGVSNKTETKQKCKQKICSYAAWDKYDVDTELLKLDLEDEKAKLKQGKERTRQTEKDRLELVVTEAEKLSETERRVLAEQEKDRGNEYYQAKDYEEAEKYYTASVAIWPTAKAYNNRAACYLKQCKYSAAVQDSNSTLQLEPDNIKAMFRRGIALKHKHSFVEALADMHAILRREPNHLQAQRIAKELREQILSFPNSTSSDAGKDKPKPMVKDYPSRDNACYEVNEWGLPKVLCKCSGTRRLIITEPKPLSKTTPPPSLHSRTDNFKNTRDKARIIELSNEHDQEKPKNSTKLKIIEIEQPPLEQAKPKNSTKLNVIEIEQPPHEPFEDFCRPTKSNVVDKRGQKQDSGRRLGGGDVF